MKPEIKKRLLRTAVFCLIALVIGMGAGWIQIQMQDALSVKKDGQDSGKGPNIAGLKIGGPFSLTNQDGKAVTEKDFAGEYKLIYFGFTFCPAICPTELQKISRVMKMLEERYPEAAKTVQPLFITVDPERDTAGVMKQYLTLFHPRITGLTGTIPQIDQIKKEYRIYATKVKDENSDEYTVDHSSFIYLMGPDDDLISMYRVNDNADAVYNDLLKQLGLS